MRLWSERPAELANLLNPAFCGFLLRTSIEGYLEASGSGMPLALTFLVLPLVLHKATREALPRGVSTTLLAWLHDHPDLCIEFPQRARSLVPFTRESLLFLTVHDLTQAAPGGLVTPVGNFTAARRTLTTTTSATDEITRCCNKSRFIGRWFAQSGDATTIYSFFGIQP